MENERNGLYRFKELESDNAISVSDENEKESKDSLLDSVEQKEVEKQLSNVNSDEVGVSLDENEQQNKS